MSKKAEELAGKIGYTDLERGRIAALIDAELVKEREACAERFKNRIEKWTPNSDYGKELKQVLLVDGVECILEGGE